jgi:predicted aspartyl protease
VSFPFQGQHGLIIVQAEVEGPAGTARLRLALDTGATDTALGAGVLATAGYDAALAPVRVQVTTASGVESVPLLTVSKLTALGLDRTAFPVMGLTLPFGMGVDGVLGLDFLRGHTLMIDFRIGQITLT